MVRGEKWGVALQTPTHAGGRLREHPTGAYTPMPRHTHGYNLATYIPPQLRPRVPPMGKPSGSYTCSPRHPILQRCEHKPTNILREAVNSRPHQKQNQDTAEKSRRVGGEGESTP